MNRFGKVLMIAMLALALGTSVAYAKNGNGDGSKNKEYKWTNDTGGAVTIESLTVFDTENPNQDGAKCHIVISSKVPEQAITIPKGGCGTWTVPFEVESIKIKYSGDLMAIVTVGGTGPVVGLAVTTLDGDGLVTVIDNPDLGVALAKLEHGDELFADAGNLFGLEGVRVESHDGELFSGPVLVGVLFSSDSFGYDPPPEAGAVTLVTGTLPKIR